MKKNLLINIFILIICFLGHALILFFVFTSKEKNAAQLELAKNTKFSVKVENLNKANTNNGHKKVSLFQNKQNSKNLARIETNLQIDAQIINSPTPEYPYLSRVNEEMGVVVLEISLNSFGNVEDVKILNSSTFKRLDEEALRFIKSVKFSPAKNSEGLSISSKLTKSISFKLDN